MWDILYSNLHCVTGGFQIINGKTGFYSQTYFQSHWTPESGHNMDTELQDTCILVKLKLNRYEIDSKQFFIARTAKKITLMYIST